MSRISIITPVDGSTYATRPVCPDDRLDQALLDARNAQIEWAAASIADRAVACTAFVDAMVSMTDDVVAELAWQMGRPVRFGAGEIAGFAERGHHMISIAEQSLAPVTPDPIEGFERWIAHEPLGLILVIAPWNYPLLTAVNSIVPALMAGNAVVLKHASQTLLAGERLQQAADTAGLPAGVFTNLVLSHQQVGRVLSGNLFDRVNFTGSVEAGRTIERAAAGTFTDVGLELGGKDPAYVRADADLTFAAANVADGAFFNSGQSCCGIERVYVDRSIFDEFVDAMVTEGRALTLGDPTDTDTTLGPMVTARAADGVRTQLEQAVAAGARPLLSTGASGWSSTMGSPYLAPEILVGVDHSMPVMTEETFGPIVGVMPVESDDEAVTLMNDSAYGLSASIWTADADAARSIGARLQTGTVFMNRADYLDPALAWTGVKDTGKGVTLSSLGYSMLTRAKSYHLRLTTPGDK